LSRLKSLSLSISKELRPLAPLTAERIKLTNGRRFVEELF